MKKPVPVAVGLSGEVELLEPSMRGLNSRDNFCASAIWSGVIFRATWSLSVFASSATGIQFFLTASKSDFKVPELETFVALFQSISGVAAATLNHLYASMK